MSNVTNPEAAKSALEAAEAKAKAAKQAELNDSDLDKVAGGINPQPLPPIEHGPNPSSGWGRS